jgi:hypothetical protein
MARRARALIASSTSTAHLGEAQDAAADADLVAVKELGALDGEIVEQRAVAALAVDDDVVIALADDLGVGL